MDHAAAAHVRACTADDMAAVANLFERVFRKRSDPAPRSLRDYFAEIYLNHPWPAADMPSLVVDSGDGTVVGFIGVVPVPVRLAGRPMRCAVGGNLMVDPTAGPLATTRLLRRFFAGPQDLAMTDTATPKAARLWEQFGGQVSRFHSMRWLLLLRTMRFGVTLAGRRRGLGLAARLATPLTGPLDRLAVRSIERAAATALPDATVVEARADDVYDLLEELGDRRTLRFDVDRAAFGWLARNTAAKTRFGPMRSILVLDGRRKPVGAAMYFPNPRGEGQVALAEALPGEHARLLGGLVADARDHHANALMGQADPQLLIPLGERASVYVQRNELVVLNARDPSVLLPLTTGAAPLGRLHGEWWTRLQGDTFT